MEVPGERRRRRPKRRWLDNIRNDLSERETPHKKWKGCRGRNIYLRSKIIEECSDRTCLVVNVQLEVCNVQEAAVPMKVHHVRIHPGQM